MLRFRPTSTASPPSTTLRRTQRPMPSWPPRGVAVPATGILLPPPTHLRSDLWHAVGIHRRAEARRLHRATGRGSAVGARRHHPLLAGCDAGVAAPPGQGRKGLAAQRRAAEGVRASVREKLDPAQPSPKNGNRRTRHAPSQPDDAGRAHGAGGHRAAGRPVPAPPAPKGAIIADSDNMHEDSLARAPCAGCWARPRQALFDVGWRLGPWVELIDGYREATDRARVDGVALPPVPARPQQARGGARDPRRPAPRLSHDGRSARFATTRGAGGDGTLDEQGKEERFKERMSRLAQTIDKSETRVVDTSPFHNAYTNLVCDRDKQPSSRPSCSARGPA